MNKHALTPKLQTFVDGVSTLLASNQSESDFHPQVGELLKTLVKEDDWLDPQFAQPHPEYYQQYLLYVDPDERFSVVSFVWGPGQQTPIHNHTVWGVIGMLRGAEYEQGFAQTADGRYQASKAEVKLLPGDIGFVSPAMGDVHRVRNAYDDQVSISIHIYGADIGKISRHVFKEDGETKAFISGYSN